MSMVLSEQLPPFNTIFFPGFNNQPSHYICSDEPRSRSVEDVSSTCDIHIMPGSLLVVLIQFLHGLLTIICEPSLCQMTEVRYVYHRLSDIMPLLYISLPHALFFGNMNNCGIRPIQIPG
ncbi:hypothetical protein BP00DRAFT_155186 [Aspergillus indologenus CBS 114.80]|uniref:Uncharacterized protein n=1 Tax=Aspergillus indologenus CBS 114.80 TaxID=1450541 RepID=A0A2V5IB20_9EURO|nr:hypothetical protein BP00DRAFT_155186 [Aspergillus indologenus CBS 114.80]